MFNSYFDITRGYFTRSPRFPTVPCRVSLALQTAETVLLKLTGFQLAFVMEAGGGSTADLADLADLMIRYDKS